MPQHRHINDHLFSPHPHHTHSFNLTVRPSNTSATMPRPSPNRSQPHFYICHHSTYQDSSLYPSSHRTYDSRPRFRIIGTFRYLDSAVECCGRARQNLDLPRRWHDQDPDRERGNDHNRCVWKMVHYADGLIDSLAIYEVAPT